MNWEAALAIIGLLEIIVTVVLTIMIRAADRRAAERDRWIGELRTKVETLEGTLAHKAEEFIDLKVSRQFAEFTAEIQKPLIELGAAVKRMDERLASGDQTFKELGEKAQEIELGAEAIKLWVRERFIPKEDFHQLTLVVSDLNAALTRCQRNCSPHARTSP